jgi:rhamnose utilization protein RhaD (predicted bifunctional aldolase and dehydrogenase)/NAD(P)-dependent dehydrogenase (short-subunit alcohol dehydrogenase family)
MQTLWSDQEAQAAVGRYADEGVCRDVALRVYTTRLLGADPQLVLHGGGNTSVKTSLDDVLGTPVEVICVKGSGWDMATIEPPGLPAVRLDPLRRLRVLDALSDEDMVNAARGNMLDTNGPTPSVETLLHAFLPHRFVDHTHANAVLSLTNQPDGEALCRDVYGGRAVVLPYIQPGFILAKQAAEAYDAAPDCQGLILAQHGIFSFGDTAQEAYELMIELVTMAEQRLASGRKTIVAAADPGPVAPVHQVATVLRGLAGNAAALPGEEARHFILNHRDDPAIQAYVNGAELNRYGTAGVATPDHAIRIKRTPLVLPAPVDLDAFTASARDAIGAYVKAYQKYFQQHDATMPGERTQLDAVPRVMLVPGIGLFALGESARQATIAGDLARATIEVVSDAEAIGRFQSITEAETFAMEYWSLEQAKLKGRRPGRLAGHIVVVTGGAGTIGLETARAFRSQGAEVVLLDLHETSVEAQAEALGGLGIGCDVTRSSEVAAAFQKICGTYGGVDIVVSNAGTAPQGRIGEVSDELLRSSFELNFFAHQSVARCAVQCMLFQGIGGSLLFNVSKQAVNPGREFGPYGLPKAALMALMRQYALDYGEQGIRSNGVNADRIRGGMLTDEAIASRSQARGVSEGQYMEGNLLRREVRKQDVAQAFVNLALAARTTGAVFTVDGGNIAAALR